MSKKIAPVTTKVSSIDCERIGKIVSACRELRHLKARQVAEYIGVDPSTYSQYEGGTRPVPANRIDRLAQALDLDPRLLDRNAA
jgi:transcriptional regulator with XRE-family HTH domain